MNRFEIAWIYWTALALVAVIGGTLLFVRGGPREPSCDSRDIKATVLDLVQKNAGLGLSTFELDDIAKTGEDPAAGTISCKATVWANYKNTPYTYAPLTYTLERQTDGEINVTVEGISGLRKSILP